MAREPERSCVGCRRRAPKAELLRVARTPSGVRADPTATAPGRGAYVHRETSCVEAALRTGAISRALRVELSEGELVRLRGDIEEASQGA
ncbi:MAG TPA: YlxR family protein [Actinomycetota bacterium]|nr:YlxR family protein [Actinomycetota bacterium]